MCGDRGSWSRKINVYHPGLSRKTVKKYMTSGEYFAFTTEEDKVVYMLKGSVLNRNG